MRCVAGQCCRVAKTGGWDRGGHGGAGGTGGTGGKEGEGVYGKNCLARA